MIAGALRGQRHCFPVETELKVALSHLTWDLNLGPLQGQYKLLSYILKYML